MYRARLMSVGDFVNEPSIYALQPSANQRQHELCSLRKVMHIQSLSLLMPLSFRSQHWSQHCMSFF